MKCPSSAEHDVLAPFIQGGYCPRCSNFDEARFSENWHAVYFLVFAFIRRFNLRDMKVLGDPMLSMIAAEIWLYGISRLLNTHRATDALTKAISEPEQRQAIMPKCNMHSIAQALDLPYQTVRRKVMLLIDQKIVEKNSKGELMISKSCEDNFMPEFNFETMRDFVSTARHVFAMLDMSLAPKHM